MGTTMKDAGSAEKFEKIDRECVHPRRRYMCRMLTPFHRYTVNAAKAAKNGATDRLQRLVYVSVRYDPYFVSRPGD
jgi:hypothetical protein